MRHAEAQPPQICPNDRDRTLTTNGLKEIDSLCLQLKDNIHGVDRILSSNVKRTRQTYEGMKKILPQNIPTSFEDSLYHASAQNLMDRLRRIPLQEDAVMIFGHNPGLHDFVSTALKFVPSSADFHSFKSGCIAIFDIEAKGWINLTWKGCQLAHFLTPDI
jgi:phosphohistidine phosphatase